MLKIILGFDSIPGGRRSTGQRQIAIETGLGMGRTGPVLGRRNFCETICYGFPLMVLCKK
jgi:hypothetical protein